MKMRPRIVLITLGLGWLAADVYIMEGHVVLRETRLGVIAQFLDKLPTRVGNPIFLLLWIVLLLGWSVPLILGFRRLRHKHSR
jgi:hypothetical protein